MNPSPAIHELIARCLGFRCGPGGVPEAFGPLPSLEDPEASDLLTEVPAASRPGAGPDRDAQDESSGRVGAPPPANFGARLATAIRNHGLASISRRSPVDLERMTGLDGRASQRLAASFELGRLVEADRWRCGDSVRTPGGVYRLMVPKLRGLDRETFFVLLLDGRHRLMETQRISEGTLTTSLVHPREVFRLAIRRSAAAIVVAHNHPSGDPEPSRQDLDVTRRLADCGKLIGIPLLDHVVIGTGAHVSIRERMEF